MATQSSVLAWRIPGMAEPGGLPSMGSHSQTRLKQLSSSSSSTHSSSFQQSSHRMTTLFLIHSFIHPSFCPTTHLSVSVSCIQLQCFQSLDSFMPSKTGLPHIHSPIYPTSLLHAGSMPRSVATEMSMSCFHPNPNKDISIQ